MPVYLVLRLVERKSTPPITVLAGSKVPTTTLKYRVACHCARPPFRRDPLHLVSLGFSARSVRLVDRRLRIRSFARVGHVDRVTVGSFTSATLLPITGSFGCEGPRRPTVAWGEQLPLTFPECLRLTGRIHCRVKIAQQF